MADKRINALTTATNSTSDDFFAIDGTTNGTKKLSAFSPTFGGNATVTGTLTANSTISSSVSTDSGVLQLNLINSSTGTSASSLFRFNAGTRTATLQAYNDTHATLAGQLRVGTSNGDIVIIPSGVTAATFGASAISLGGLSSATTITGGDTGSGTNILLLKDGLGTLKVNFKGNGDVALLSSTASTSTSSGALVVSGGVGVAGAINAGGAITSTNGSGSGLLGMRSSSGNASYVFWSETGVSDRGILGFNNGSSTLSYRSNSSSFATGTEVFSVTSAGNVTAGGNITTAAPSGGTAAAWKLGTVASVSPTSPNRTIEVDIGGTIYYIAAKTTNN